MEHEWNHRSERRTKHRSLHRHVHTPFKENSDKCVGQRTCGYTNWLGETSRPDMQHIYCGGVHTPQRQNEGPTSQDTKHQLKTFLITVSKSDCVIMGDGDDLNWQLQRNIPGCTGKWWMTTKPDGDHVDEMIELIRLHDLFVVDTLFKHSNLWKNDGEQTEVRPRFCNVTYLQMDDGRHTKTDESWLHLCNKQMEVNDEECEN